MSLRTRIAALTAAVVAVAVLVVSIGALLLTRRELRQQVDETLIRRAREGARVEFRPGPAPGRRIDDRAFDVGLDNSAQLISADGDVLIPASQERAIPVSRRDQAVAARAEPPYFHELRIDGTHLRVLTAPVGRGNALMFARDLTEVDTALRNLGFIMFFLGALGIAGAAGAGLIVARRAVVPVERLTGAAEHVAKTKDLSASIDVEGTDELARLGMSFNEMLAALAESREQQRRLVADASHELRTPLTSLRTNVEVLAKNPAMKPAVRAKVLGDLSSELEELSALVAELVALATEQRADDEELQEVDLAALTEAVADRARRRTGRTVNVTASGVVLAGRPLGLERALTNLVDNAAKWGPPDEPIDVAVSSADGTARAQVRDRGPGIAADDRPHVFDRFYRATSARSMPGSGLGLSIVKQVVDAHGGRVFAHVPSDGGPGAVVGFELPSAAAFSGDS